jgi:hypothetical protein
MFLLLSRARVLRSSIFDELCGLVRSSVLRRSHVIDEAPLKATEVRISNVFPTLPVLT